MLFKDRDKKCAGEDGEQYIYFAYNGEIIGQFVLTNLNGTRRYVHDLRIYEEYRNQGYGNLMIAEMVEKYGNDNNIPLTLDVLIDNLPALHLYLKYGFKIYDDTISEIYYHMKYERK